MEGLKEDNDHRKPPRARNQVLSNFRSLTVLYPQTNTMVEVCVDPRLVALCTHMSSEGPSFIPRSQPLIAP